MLGGRVRPIYFRGLIKCWGGGYAKIFYGLENTTRTANYIIVHAANIMFYADMAEKSMV